MNAPLSVPVAATRIVALPSTSQSQRVVQKALEAIQINVVVGELSLLQRKILNILLENAKTRLAETEIHEIPFREVIRRLNYNSNDYKPIRDALDELPTRRIQWNYLNRGSEKDYGVSAYISEVKYVGNMVRYAYPPTVREMLHSPRRFAVLNLAVQNAFSRQYSLPLYEIVKQSLEAGETPAYSVTQWRDLLGLPKGNSYGEFKHLRAKVLNPAVDEINGNSDISTAPVFHRQGRNIVALSFTVASNPQLPLSLEPPASCAQQLVERMVALGFKETLARQYLTRFPEDYVSANLAVVESRQEKGQIKSNPAGYLARALESDYRPTGSSVQQASPVRSGSPGNLAEQRKSVYRQFSAAREVIVKTALANLTPDELTALEEDFLQEVTRSNSLVAAQYRRSGLRSMLVRTSFNQFAARQLGCGEHNAMFAKYLAENGLDPALFAELLTDPAAVAAA